MTPKPSATERERTDQSLAGEREKADAAFVEQTAIERLADEVLDRARRKADEVLSTARDTADHKLAESCGDPRSAVQEERALEDEAVEELRAKADAILRAERRANARLLIRLLPLEREKTDRHLLTERARSDAAVSNRDDFLGMVSHDLRDLLSSVAINAAQIDQESESGDAGASVRAAVARIQRAAGRMNRLIGDLVDVTSIDAGKLAIRTALSNVAEVVDEATDTWGPHARAKAVTLQTSAPRGISCVLDRERILQVLGNLITNAIKFSPSGTTVLVAAESKDGELRFSVTDSGGGVPAENLDSIFERFWQAGRKDRRGLGLGLYISRCLVIAHGGRIWAESEPGAGSVFRFTVPAAR